MTTTRKETPFSSFLEQDKVKNQIKNNVETLLNKDTLASGSGFSCVSRYFNNLPEYSRMKPLLNCLVDAVVSKDSFEIWLYVAIAVALDDLFDTNGDLYPEVTNALNVKKTTAEEGAWDTILHELQPKEKIYAYLFCSYLQMFNSHGSKLITVLPDAGSTDLEKNPCSTFTRINKEFKYLEEINKEFIDIHIAKLAATILDEKYTLDKIRPFAECQLLILQLKQLLNVQQEETTLHKHVRTALKLVREKFYDPDSTLALENIIIILRTLKNSLKHTQTQENLAVCKLIAEQIDKLSPGEIIKGVAIGVGTAVTLVVTAVTALASFGFIALPALAFSSPIIGGGAAASSAASLGGNIYNGFSFFNRLFGKSSLAEALGNVANEVNAVLEMQLAEKKKP